MVSFSQAKDLYKMQKQAKRIKKELKNIHVEAEGPGVKVIVSAEQEVVEIILDETIDIKQLPTILKDTTNRAMKKAQLVAAEKMQAVMGNFGGMMGGGEGGMPGMNS